MLRWPLDWVLARPRSFDDDRWLTMPSMRAAQKAFTRQRLIEAAQASFVNRGYLGTTVDAITSDAGTTRATFYLHFASKAEIANAVWEAYVDSPTQLLWNDLGPIIAGVVAQPNLLKTVWFPRVVEHWDERGLTIHSLWHARALEPLLDAELKRTKHRVANTICEALMGLTGYSRAALRIRATAAFELQTQMFFDWISGDIPLAMDDVIDALSDAWLALLVTPVRTPPSDGSPSSCQSGEG
ncbi:hypothetical protein AYX19_21540 (plasmid) [Paenarthrobacter ureafaciens]|nr:hypothetical protein AYX19_21045 [Paenarthrobacter ureafaciens]QSZ55672.1 hypothetical protein AYX19_21540 [Paenarthrobacter ureafaciens]